MIFLIFVALLIVLLTVLFWKCRSILNDNVKPLKYEKDTRMDGKTVLITGATSGIGKATAFELASRGARVILACRNRQKADLTCQEIREETGNDNITVVDLDLSDLDSVKSAADEVNKSESRLDVLINNAAIGLADYECSKQGFELIFATNHIGHFLLTHLLLDLIKRSAPSRIINVSSKMNEALRNELDFTLHSEGSAIKYSNLKGYQVSKLANIYHSRFLSEELAVSRVTINAMHPGLVDTEIMKRDVKDPVTRFMNFMTNLAVVHVGRSSKDAAQTLVYMAVDPELTEVTGEYFENVSIQTQQLTSLACNKEQARKMREVSFLACKDYLDLPEDIVKVEEVGAVLEGSLEKEEKCADEEFLPSATEMKADLENISSNTSSISCESSITATAVEEASRIAATPAAAAETAAEAAVEAATAVTVAATIAETTKISTPESNVFSESNLLTSPCTFTPSLDTENKNNLELIENLTSDACSLTNENIETTQESVHKPLILPEITEANEHYPPAEGDSNLNCDTTNVCSDHMSSSREDSPLITFDDVEKSGIYREEETF